jgi:hypothetical protein
VECTPAVVGVENNCGTHSWRPERSAGSEKRGLRKERKEGEEERKASGAKDEVERKDEEEQHEKPGYTLLHREHSNLVPTEEVP